MSLFSTILLTAAACMAILVSSVPLEPREIPDNPDYPGLWISGPTTRPIDPSSLSFGNTTTSGEISIASDPGVHCYKSGAWMGNTELEVAITTWCVQNSAAVVAPGHEVAMVVGGLRLGNGKIGFFTGRYVNNGRAPGWTIWSDECMRFMRDIVYACQGKNRDSQGGHNTVGYGSVWADANV